MELKGETEERKGFCGMAKVHKLIETGRIFVVRGREAQEIQEICKEAEIETVARFDPRGGWWIEIVR